MKTARTISLSAAVLASAAVLLVLQQGTGVSEDFLPHRVKAGRDASLKRPSVARTAPRAVPTILTAEDRVGGRAVDFTQLETTFVAPPPVPSHLRPIVRPHLADMGARLKAARGLSENLSSREITALYGFLQSLPGPEEKNLAGLQALKNDILNVLRDQTTPPAGLTDTLIEMYRNPAQDDVIRDYALQHLVSWYEQGAADAPDTKARIRAVLQEAVSERSSLAGTALLGLHRLSENNATFAAGEIDRLAARLTCAPDTDPATRITAIQVCAERGLKEALPMIELLAQAPGCVPLRLSAIAALGRLGGAPQVVLLRTVEAGENEAVRDAVRLALRQLVQREGLL